MAMTKSRRTSASHELDWSVVAKQVGITDFDDFCAKSDQRIREGAGTYRRAYGASKTCSYDQATHSMFLAMIGMNDAVIGVLLRHCQAMAARLKALETAQTKSAPLPYQGAWKQGQEYLPGQFLTFQGSIWHVDKKTCSRPGDDPSAFTLAVKSGRDGKDARP